MTQIEILEEFKKLPADQRFAALEAIFRLIREELQDRNERKKKLVTAAQRLLSDYTTDVELTSFTALDSEDFHGER